ncbi:MULTISPECIES: hypothetical protein [unclassified Xanthomonas]|uniref:hypothetical protein n=1 Tax=unclassified Xanthomonas TaxID=2643310 RepID=UPI002883470A|nr:hypothetical protein [Xanthomonas sp. WCS2018Noco2-28]
MAWRDRRVRYRSQGLPTALFAQTVHMSLLNGGKPKRTGVIASTPAHRAASQLSISPLTMS